ncbi:hypothetical protein AK812_SmicGene10179 [Symbiodinium microadriaticum]|uniref:Uncharacterized protein n=1 Tax=Symbiodinium microadriaticum TaxID=2951 RepID=A0A1Q9EGL7_SYMMI|nr:hypothetical protein AK812_SmicGene10179 [Symbiodinium microadriaticum]CAE7487521.1 unnamed protein product [Symbiodinium microadriaticum]
MISLVILSCILRPDTPSEDTLHTRNVIGDQAILGVHLAVLQKAIDLDTLDISDRDLAAGNDGMPPDLLHYFPGGSVSHIYKHKGDIADCFPVTLASQTVRSYQEGCLARGKSTAIIFLDLKEAFHKVARPLVHGGDMSDSHLIKVMQIFGLPAGHMDLLRSYVQQESLLVGAGASSWAALMIKEFQEDSWLTVGDGLAVVETGTRPGDSLADIVFSFLFAAVLKQVRAALIAAGFDVMLPWSEAWFRSLCPTGAPDEHLAPIDVSWMDDLALLLSADAPASLVNAVQGAASTLIDECLKALLHPNLARQKR